MSNEKVMIILLTVGLIEMIFLYKMNYFPEPFTHNKSKAKLELGFFTLAMLIHHSFLKSLSELTKTQILMNQTLVIDIVDLGTLSDALKKEVVKQAVYDELVKKS